MILPMICFTEPTHENALISGKAPGGFIAEIGGCRPVHRARIGGTTLL
jgi:hypothetical protein